MSSERVEESNRVERRRLDPGQGGKDSAKDNQEAERAVKSDVAKSEVFKELFVFS